MGQPVAITDQNLETQLAPYIGVGTGFFGTTKVAAIGDLPADIKAILVKDTAFGADIGGATDKTRQLDMLRDTGLLKRIIDEANAQKAVLKPKEYLEKFNEDKMDVITRSSKAALAEREVFVKAGASTQLANAMADAIYNVEKNKNDLILAFKYPSDITKDVEEKLKKNSSVQL